MAILPVLDLMGGVVVRGIAGQRATYRPIVSTLTASAEPRAVAQALRAHFGFRRLYLADLDAIAGQPPARAVYRALRDDGWDLWVDAGLRTWSDGTSLEDATTVVVGLETVAGPRALAEIVAEVGPARLVFSLDLKGGMPLSRAEHWPERDIEAVATTALDLGVRRFLVLDLARVGMGQGVGTEGLCDWLRARDAALEISAGGGVRGIDDVRALETRKVDFVLVVSALHDGRISALEAKGRGS